MNEETEKKAASGDLTKGTIWKKIVIYALPLLAGAVLQQLYNAVDAIVVGQMVGNNALAAVGSVGPIIFLLVAMFMGLSVGSCVVIANYFGKKDRENLSRAAHTAIVLSVIIGLILTVIGVALVPVLLTMIAVPPEIFVEAQVYLSCIFAGMVAFSIYNIGASILQAVGNTRYPLYFLIVSTISNIVLDILFVAAFDMGVAGVAVSTVISEGLSAALVLIVLFNSKREYKLSFKKMRIDKNMMRRIVAIGLPSALQQSIVAFSNIFVQSYINGFGATVIAGFAAEGKIEIFVVLPIVALSTAVTTFVSQNLGAGEEKRARRGVFVAMLISLVTSIIVIGAVLASFGLLVRAFTGDPEVIKAAWFFAFCFIPGQLFFAVLYTFQSALRGARNVKFSVICSVGCFVVFRQIYLAFVRQINYDLFWIAFGYPLAWGLCTVLVTIYFFSKNHITAGDMTRIHIQHTNTANGDFLSFCKRMDDFQNQYVPGRKETGMNSIYNAENLKDIFLMYDDKKPIGTACLWQHDAETCEVLRMFIDDKYRGQAHGAKLISEVENYARTLGYKHIIMRTFKTLPGVDIFDKHGFKIVDQDNFTHIDRFQNAATIAPYRVYMNKDL